MSSLFVNCFLLFGVLIFWCYGDDVKKHPLQDTIITNVPVKAYESNSRCAQHRLSKSLNVLSNVVPPIETCVVCNDKEHVKNEAFTNSYSSKHCVEKSYKCENIPDLGEKLMGQLEAISTLIQSHPTTCLEVKQQKKCSLSGYYKILSPNGSLISVYCDMEGNN